MNSAAQAPAGVIPDADRQALEQRLAPGLRLDGTIASLWAVEAVLEAVRSVGTFYNEPPTAASLLRSHCPWLAPYLRQLFARAFGEMGLQVAHTEQHLLRTDNPPYQMNLVADCEKLIAPPTPFPTLFKMTWEARAPLGLGAAAWYGLASVMQNQEWAEAHHLPIANCQDHLGRGYHWLTRQHVWACTQGHPPWQALATSLVGALVWPPIAYPKNELGEHNLPQIDKILSDPTTDQQSAQQILLRLASSQDQGLAILAAQSCITHNVAPTNMLEALSFARAVQHFETRPEGAVKEALAQLLPGDQALGEAGEASAEGVDHPRFAIAAEAVETGDHQTAYRLLSQLADAFPARSVYLCKRGEVSEAMQRPDLAAADYTKTLEHNANDRQALLARAMISARYHRFDECDQDLLTARGLRPGCPETRKRYVMAYLLRRLMQG